MTIRACAFDAYGTLFDVSGIPGDPELMRVWRRKQLEYTWLRALMRRHVDFWELTADALDVAMRFTGASDPDLRARLLESYRTLPVYPDVAPTLRALRESGVKTAILSNGEPTMLAAAIAAAGLGDLLDEVLSVEEVGVFKPDPRVYQCAVDRLDTPRHAIAFMTANAWDAHGAACSAFRSSGSYRFDQAAERLPGEPIAEVSSLARVPEALGI